MILGYRLKTIYTVPIRYELASFWAARLADWLAHQTTRFDISCGGQEKEPPVGGS